MSAQAAAATHSPAPSGIVWPEHYQPSGSPVHVRNEIQIAAPPEAVWAWLLRAADWPDWYANAANIHFLSHTGPDLRDRSRFRWNTFGIRVTSKVLEFQPCTRLGWEAHGIGLNAWHGWLLTATPDGGTHVLTEETQHGWLARLGKRVMPNHLSAKHQMWLEGLKAQAEQGMPE